MAENEGKSSRQADHWQRKYYNTLEDLEDKEKEWRALESMLRTLVARLTLISSATDNQLEKKLDRLREGMRDGRDLLRMSNQIEEVSRYIAQHDFRQSTQAPTENPADVLRDLLDTLSIPKSLQRQEKHIRKRLQASVSEREVPELIKDMAELFGLIIDEAAQTSQPSAAAKEDKASGNKKSGLFSSLFGEKEPAADEVSPQKEEREIHLNESQSQNQNQPGTDEPNAEVQQAPLPEFEVVDESDDPHHSQSKTESEPDAGEETIEYMEALSVRDIAYAGEILIQLLEKMELPNDLCVEAGLIRQRLEPCETHETLQKGLEATIALVADAHARAVDEKKEMEKFLQQLTERLHEIDTDLQETARLREQAASDRNGMNEAIREEVSNMEESAKKAQDLSSLQTAIQSRVIIIRNHMDRFLENQHASDDRYKIVATHLKKRLSEAENEIEILRARLEKERLLAMTDTLTALPNRQAGNLNVEDALARLEKNATDSVIMMLDIDRFGAINEKYGHAAGDKVLKVIGRIIATNVRETDRPSRQGGEKFSVVMPDTGIDDALILADKIRKMIEDCAFHFRKKRVVITASCGLTQCRVNDTPAMVFQRANDALYQAKQNGRNRCEISV